MIARRTLPDRMFMEVHLTAQEAVMVADLAAQEAKKLAPKLSGAGAAGIEAISGQGFIGVRWAHDRVLYQDQGIRPFTMNSLAGKVIPMWIDDPTGVERQRNPKAKVRVMSGRTQVLIFRRAAKQGERKTVNQGGVVRSVPRSYPGAPGRIAIRQAGRPWTTEGKIAGAIAPTNVGVRWRHPGLLRRGFLEEGLRRACDAYSIPHGVIHITDDRGVKVAV